VLVALLPAGAHGAFEPAISMELASTLVSAAPREFVLVQSSQSGCVEHVWWKNSGNNEDRDMAAPASAAFKPPAALVNNAAQIMGSDADAGLFWLNVSHDDILRSYKLHGNRYFFSDLDAQTLTWLLDRKLQTPAAIEFRKHWGENALDDMAECEKWRATLTAEQRIGVQNLRCVLMYALLPYKKVSDFEAHADVFVQTMSKKAVAFLVTPLLKTVVALVPHVLELVNRIDEQNQTDAGRLLTRNALFERATNALDHVVLDILFNALCAAPEKIKRTAPAALRDRLDLLRHFIKERALAKVA
jgi:hypothetical protein